MRKVNRTHKIYWSFEENNTIISIDTCRLTISLNTGLDRHQDAMETSESFDVFLETNSTIKNYLNSYKHLQHHSDQIVASLKYYNSDDYFSTITPEEYLNFEKYNPKRAAYIKVKFPQVVNFKANVERIEKINKRSVKALFMLIVFLILFPAIFSFYTFKAIYFLVPSIIFSIFLIHLLLKIRRYKPKYGKAEIIEIYQSHSTLPSKNLSPTVYFAKVKAHTLYDFKNGYIDVDNFQEVDVISYQIPTNFHEYLKGKKSVQFLTRGRNDLFEIIN